MDETSKKIIDATMSLLRDKGYVATTTKDIARQAGVNECTLFRKFKGKKEIVLCGLQQARWRADVTPELFAGVTWNLERDLEMFMTKYMEQITPDFVNLSIGLRAPQLFHETAEMIMQVPQAFLSSLIAYFEAMEKRGNIKHQNFESLAMTIFSATFGYTFLKASFQDALNPTKQSEYIHHSVKLFVKGIQ